MERVERKAFCFSINGEFITQLAKERFFMEGTPSIGGDIKNGRKGS